MSGACPGAPAGATEGDWTFRAEIEADESGRVTFEDPDLQSGARYDYTLEVVLGASRIATGETSITTSIPPALRLARLGPNPATSAFRVTLEIPRSGSGEVDLFDVLGRRVAHHELGRLEPGLKDIDVERGDLASGVYLVRIGFESSVVTSRVVFVR